jgi:eukaryotic-like serine/threonine-protein kinase
MAEQFGGYLLLERIGVGGMAEVFLARHSGLAGFEKNIVIKRIRPHLSDVPSFVNMFLAEAKLAAQLTHPHVVQIYDLGKIRDSYFIAMEYIPGRDLSALVPKLRHANIPFPVEYALKVGSNVCEALTYAYTKTDGYGAQLSIVHRDVSPENIRVAWTGTVKVLDFGIAKASSQLEGDETKAGEIKGKLSYMSPEQVKGKSLDQRSDIFSLGAVLYECLTGVKLFSGENDLSIMNNIVGGNIYPPSYFREDVPKAVELIVMKALEQKRHKRYSSTLDMQFEIDSFLARHEFAPTNFHLSNFIKQVFAKELEEEEQRRRKIAPDPKAIKDEATPSIHMNPETVRSIVTEHRTPLVSVDPGLGREGQSKSIEKASAKVSDKASSEGGKARLQVELSKKNLNKLKKIAGVRRCSPSALTAEILSDFMKYHTD